MDQDLKVPVKRPRPLGPRLARIPGLRREFGMVVSRIRRWAVAF